MRKRFLVLAAVPFGLLLLLVLFIVSVFAILARMYRATRTGVAALDSYRWRVCVEVVRQFGLTGASPRIGRAVMAIIHAERDPSQAYQVGDLGSPGGPSVGPMQVSRRTAKDLGLWSPPGYVSTAAEEAAVFAELARNEGWGIHAGVAVLKAKLADDPRLDNVKLGHLSGGDLLEALKLYNGWTGAAGNYRDRLVAYASSTWTGGLDA